MQVRRVSTAAVTLVAALALMAARCDAGDDGGSADTGSGQAGGSSVAGARTPAPQTKPTTKSPGGRVVTPPTTKPKGVPGPARLTNSCPKNVDVSCEIRGSGFEAEELVDLTYQFPQGRGEGRYGPVRTDEDGTFRYGLLHPADGTVKVTASGQTSKRTAQTSYVLDPYAR